MGRQQGFLELTDPPSSSGEEADWTGAGPTCLATRVPQHSKHKHILYIYGSAHAKAGGRAGTRSLLCTTRMLVATKDWKAFLNTWLPTLQQPNRHNILAQQHQSYRAMMVNVLHLYLIAHNWQQQATQAPGCTALLPASSPVQGWMVRQLNKVV